MKKIDIKEIILIIVIIILGIFISLNLFKNNKVTFITDSDYLYDKAIKYLLKYDDNVDRNKKNDKVIKVIFTQDGEGYKVSIINMYPKEIAKKVLNYRMDDSNLKKIVDNYYKSK